MNIEEMKKYIKQNGITYEQVAESSGIALSTIRKIFAGISKYPRIDTVQAIERALGLSEDEISNITYEERQLIKDFRTLDPKGQKVIKDAISALKK